MTWATAESAVTIVAASIPILRVLIQEAARTRYASNKKKTSQKSNSDQTFAVEMDSQTHGETPWKGDSTERLDDHNDRSNFNRVGNGIVQTTEIRVDSHERAESDFESMVYKSHAVRHLV